MLDMLLTVKTTHDRKAKQTEITSARQTDQQANANHKVTHHFQKVNRHGIFEVPIGWKNMREHVAHVPQRSTVPGKASDDLIQTIGRDRFREFIVAFGSFEGTVLQSRQGRNTSSYGMK